VTEVPGAPAAATGSPELFARWRRSADRAARDELVERYLPLAHKLAGRYANSSESFDDLVQVASLGLVKAVERFDPERGFAFTSFAVPTIVGELKRYFRDSGWAVHVNRGAQELAHRVTDAQRKISAQTGRPPTIGDLAQYLEVSDEDVLEGLQAAEAYDAVSLDAPASDDAEGAPTSRIETLGGADRRLDIIDAQTTITAAARHLPRREREILLLRFGADLTQTEIAERIGVSQMQVSRLLRNALAHLRELTDDRDRSDASAPAI